MGQEKNEEQYLTRLALEFSNAVFNPNYNFDEYDKRINDIKLRYNINSSKQYEKINDER